MLYTQLTLLVMSNRVHNMQFVLNNCHHASYKLHPRMADDVALQKQVDDLLATSSLITLAIDRFYISACLC